MTLAAGERGRAKSDGRSRQSVALVLAMLPPALLYWLTLYPGVGGRVNVGDSAKFQYVGEVLGVPHHPGYPQYVVLNFLWTRLPLPLSLAERVNLLSAVFSIAAAGFLFAALYRLTRSRTVSWLGTWTVSLASAVWVFSTEAEVYSLHLLYTASILWTAVEFRRDGRARWLVTMMVLLGLSAGNHPTTVLFVPGLLVLVATPEGRRLGRWRWLFLVVIALLVGLSQYSYLMWRSHSDAPFVEGIRRRADLEDLASTLTGSRFTSQHLLRLGIAGAVTRLGQSVVEAVRQLWPVALVLVPFGGTLIAKRDRSMALFLVLLAIGPVAFVALYHIGDWEAYLAPTWVALAGLAALGALALSEAGGRWGRVAAGCWGLSLVILGGINFRALDLEESPWERSWLLATAPTGTRVVTYNGPGYRAHQLNNYYRYGVLHGSTEKEILTGVEVVQSYAFLEDLPLYATRKVGRDVLEPYKIDHVERLTSSGRMLWTTGERYPLHELRVGRSVAGALEVVSSDGIELISATEGIHFAVVEARGGRIKGVMHFPAMDTLAEAREPTPQGFLEHVQVDDWLIAVMMSNAWEPLADGTMERFAEWSGFALGEEASEAGAVVVIGRMGEVEPRLLATDLDQPRTVELGP